MRLDRLAVASLLILAAASAPAAAQGRAQDALTPGNRALSFALPHGGGNEFGLWKVVSPTRSRGLSLFVQGDYFHSDDQAGERSNLQLGLGPRARRYLGAAGAIAPFVQSGVTLLGGYESQTGAHAWNAGLGGELALGAQWFAFRRIALEGHTGFRPSVNVRRFVGANDATTWNVHLETFTSAFAVEVYF